jgi:hypothetical protein
MSNLEIPLNERLIQKIKAFAEITGSGSQQLENLFVEAIEHKLNDEIIRESKTRIQTIVEQEQAILKSAGINPDFLISPVQHSGISRQLEAVGQFPDAEPVLPLQEKIRGLDTSNAVMPEPASDYLKTEENYLPNGNEEDDDEMFVGSLGGDEEEFDKMDETLSEEDRAEFLLPEDDDDEVERELSHEDEEEDDMDMIKDKNGNETEYEDDFMNDIQSEVDDFDDGMDDIMAAAAGSFKDTDNLEGGATGSSGKVASDAPTGEDGFVPDVLPTDFGMNGVAGDDKSAADFFTKAMMGQTGDKSLRNNITRKRIKTSY